jgi:HAD superfamily hydrolase (TIGR01509 family)
MKTILVDAWHTFVTEEGIFQNMKELLNTYPNTKIILTSANDEQMVTFGLNNMPYEVFTLKHNPEKSNPKYYEIMLEKFKLDKSEVIYFEHNGSAVKSAQSVGIITYHYNKDKKDLVGLKEFIDRNIL